MLWLFLCTHLAYQTRSAQGLEDTTAFSREKKNQSLPLA
jgi:hypothetical protein